MARIKVQHIYGTKEKVDALKEEHDWIGRHVTKVKPPSSDNNNKWELVVYPIPPKKRTKKKEEREKRETRPRKGNGFNRYKDINEA